MASPSKLKKFGTPYASIEEVNGMAILYTLTGDYSVVIKMLNPVVQHTGDDGKLIAAQQIFSAITGMLDDNCILQKQDIFAKCKLQTKRTDGDWLSQSYFHHFNGKEHINGQTYLILTQQAKKGFFTFEEKIYKKFIDTAENVIRLLATHNMQPRVLNRETLKRYLFRSLSVNFSDPSFSLNTIEVDRNGVHLNDRNIKQLSLIDLEELNFPLTISPVRKSTKYDEIDFPEDNMTFLLRVPNVDTIIYTQTIFMPNQSSEIKRLKKKRNHHDSAMGEGNRNSSKDITGALEIIEKVNKKLVYANFTITLAGKGDMAESISCIENELYPIGIIPSRRCVNQFELFRATTLPGNAVELKEYDKFLVPQDASLSLFYKESPQVDEHTQFPVYFCTRDNVPVAIDMFDTIIKNDRVPNCHMCVIGPSGSGKSFFTNEYIRQNLARNMHIVLIDVGHSYKGLCEYYNGKYISYTSENPITMNPFLVNSRKELNTDKNKFFLSLITVIWRGAEQSLTKSEETVILNTVSAYYNDYFDRINDPKYLKFDTFYGFADKYIREQIEVKKVRFELDDFNYVLSKYAKGGIYERILNEDADRSLFEERFVIFEIDSIKGDADLYPIVTLVIMDLFTQKLMTLPRETGKVFIIEEAWKSITSPVMQPYITWLWRTIRKYRGQAVVVTQEIQDLVDNPAIKDVIINNSPIMCLLKQEKKTFQKLINYLALTEAEANIVASLGLDGNNGGKEVYIKRGTYGEPYRVIVSPQEYWVFTTRSEEKALVEKYKEAYAEAFATQCAVWAANQKRNNILHSIPELEKIYYQDHATIEYAIEQLVSELETFLREKKGFKDDFVAQVLVPEYIITPNISEYEKKLC